MSKELIVYGLAAGVSEDWQEEILSTQCRTLADVERIKAAASKDGWHSFRVMEYKGERPDFAAILKS